MDWATSAAVVMEFSPSRRRPNRPSVRSMSSIKEAVQLEIDERRARCVGRPDRELVEHLLIGVQRERVAAVGYDTKKLGERIARSPMPDSAKQLFMRVITQIWLDETLHARYVLGVLLRQRAMLVQLGARREDVEGGVGGWMTAVVQHTTWSEAPAERLVASVIELGGKLSRRIPEEVVSSLLLAPLRDWCAFAADAEESAVLSFGRMVDLAREVVADPARFPECELPAGIVEELSRMLRDERAHADVFAALASSLDDDDGLLGSFEDLDEAIAGIDGWSNGPRAGSTRTTAHPVCRGGLVVVARGDDKIATFDRAIDEGGLFEVLEPLGKEVEIAIKVDLMLAYDRRDRSSYVDPVLIERLTTRLWERGYTRIAVCDAQNVYGRYYANRSIDRIARYVGLTLPHARLVDLDAEQDPHTFTHAMGVSTIGRTWQQAGARISFAKLKTHPMAIGQLTLRNTGTVVPQNGEYFFGDRLSDFSRVTAGVLFDFPPCFGIIDGFENAADGLVGVIADPTPKHPHVILAGPDVASVDCVAFAMMGERNPARAADLRAAVDLFGDPRSHIRVVGDATPIPNWDRADAGLLSSPLSALASPVYAALSRQGALFVAALDPDEFPPVGETRALAAVRSALRVLLGIDR